MSQNIQNIQEDFFKQIKIIGLGFFRKHFQLTVMHLEPSQTSKMEIFLKIVNGF